MASVIMAIMQLSPVCRLCLGTMVIKNSVALLSPTAASQSLVTRISLLLEFTVAADDGLPHQLCKPCKRRLDSLEKAVEDLQTLKKKNGQ